jgi:hypothetical protein
MFGRQLIELRMARVIVGAVCILALMVGIGLLASSLGSLDAVPERADEDYRQQAQLVRSGDRREVDPALHAFVRAETRLVRSCLLGLAGIALMACGLRGLLAAVMHHAVE